MVKRFDKSIQRIWKNTTFASCEFETNLTSALFIVL